MVANGEVVALAAIVCLVAGLEARPSPGQLRGGRGRKAVRERVEAEDVLEVAGCSGKHTQKRRVGREEEKGNDGLWSWPGTRERKVKLSTARAGRGD
jgi:hypothetical protein